MGNQYAKLRDLEISPTISSQKSRESWKRAIRIEQGRRSLKKFCEIYLQHHFSKPFGEHHDDLFEQIESPEIGKHVVRAEPREHGKSTTMIVGTPLWHLAYKKKWYILLLGASSGSLWNHFSSLQQELDTMIGNKLLQEDFPHLSPMLDFKSQFVSWNDSSMKITSGAYVECRSIHSKIRGVKEQQRRPDLIIVDDPQDDEDIATYFRREKLSRRFKTTIMNLGDVNCDFFVEGNLLDNDSLIGELLLDTSWNRKLYRAENLPPRPNERFPVGNTKTDGTALWPAAWPIERLRKRKQDIKARAYDLEFQNYERAEEDTLYESTQFKRFNLAEFLVTSNNLQGFEVVGFWDPANPKEKSRDPDFPSITIMATKEISVPAEDDEGKPKKSTLRWYWVLENWMERKGPEGQCDAAIGLCTRFPIRKMAYEDNGGFGTMIPYLYQRARDQNVTVPLKEFSQNANKIQRIMNAEPVIKHRTFFADHLSALYMSQWDDFPGSHDDGPDSTVGCIEMYEKLKKSFVFKS